VRFRSSGGKLRLRKCTGYSTAGTAAVPAKKIIPGSPEGGESNLNLRDMWNVPLLGFSRGKTELGKRGEAW